MDGGGGVDLDEPKISQYDRPSELSRKTPDRRVSLSATRGFTVTQWAAPNAYVARLLPPSNGQLLLRDTAASTLKEANHTVEVRDLYAEGFVPTMSADERDGYYGGSPNLRREPENVWCQRSPDRGQRIDSGADHNRFSAAESVG
jgi:hypothetical protein